MGSKVPFWKNWKIAKIPSAYLILPTLYLPTYLTFFSFKFRFTVPEEEEPGYFVGKVEANDPDEGKNGRVFYYIIDGNVEKWFSVDKTYGNIYTKKRLDREERDHYMIQVKTTNNPDLVRAHHMFWRILNFLFLMFFSRDSDEE